MLSPHPYDHPSSERRNGPTWFQRNNSLPGPLFKVRILAQRLTATPALASPPFLAGTPLLLRPASLHSLAVLPAP